MGLYSDRILPWLTHLSMRNRLLRPYRERLVPQARGRVLEVGIGSGLNLPLYGPAVELVVGLDPSRGLLRRAAATAAVASTPLVLTQASAEAMPLADASIDTIVMTWTLCSIPDAPAALGEMRRVLKPRGALLFVEHGLSPDERVARWQHRLDPLWVRVSCHLDNPVEAMLRQAGFALDELRTGYLGRGPRPLAFMYEGRARPA
jgi:ubiquinone/menaquinone biosynthesis C-methylase UbiE